jgi:hypothetical protein
VPLKRSYLLLIPLALAACAPRTCESPADFVEDSQLAKIEIHYPHTSVRAMTCELRQDIDDRLMEFRAGLPASLPNLNGPYEFDASGALHSPKHGLESAELEFFKFTGRAHPNSECLTLSYAFDSQGWYRLDLAKLFKPGTDWHALLLPYAQAAAWRLNKDKDWVDKGLEDKSGQWSRFVMDFEGLTLIFEPHQVAPYVAGRVRVFVPWEKLKTQLNPRWFK